MIKLGISSNFQIEPVAGNGYDYIEFSLSALRDMAQERFDAIAQQLRESGLQAECFNGFFPGDMRIVGPQRDMARIAEYAHQVLTRAARMGAQLAVLGSGASRKSEDGDVGRARAELMEVAALLGDLSEQYGITIVMEPLSRLETDVLNTVEDAYRFCEELGHPQVCMLADLYHMQVNGDDFAALGRLGKRLVHVHLSEPVKRVFPAPGDGYDYTPFLEGLKAAGYAGRISIEANTGNLEHDAKAARPLVLQMKSFLER